MDRSKEEILDVLQFWPDAFRESFGKELDKETLKSVLKQILQDKELEIIRQRFFDFSPKNIREIIEILEIKPKEQKASKKLK